MEINPRFSWVLKTEGSQDKLIVGEPADCPSVPG